MSGDVAIRVEGLGKTYPVYASPLDALKELLPGRVCHTEFAALSDVSFSVRRRERVGIVGANGAGKSTLLKILAGTIDHTAGAFAIDGSLRAILELGTGFHEECTGRENILMGGLCLGYGQRELEERTDWIISFSELGRVIDQPLRTYSSGMKMRLMYSVAFCRPVEIMIIDEALATGDGAFVRKCTNHIVELCGGGTTALIVSHNLYFLERMCHRVLYLREGRLVADGDPLEVCKQYERDLGRSFVGEMSDAVSDFRRDNGDAAPVSDDGSAGDPGFDPERADPIAGDPADADGAGGDEPAPFVDHKPVHAGMLDPDAGPRPPRLEPVNGAGERVLPDGSVEPIDFTGAPEVRTLGLVRLLEVRMFDGEGRPTQEVATGRPCRFRFVFESRVRKEDVHLGFMIWNDQQEHVATTTNVCSLDGHGRPNGLRLDLVDGVQVAEVVLPSLQLGAGRYYLKFGVAPGVEHYSEDDLLVSENRCFAFSVLRHDHVQSVHYEPHAVWAPLRRVGGLPRADGTGAEDRSPDRPARDPAAVHAPARPARDSAAGEAARERRPGTGAAPAPPARPPAPTPSRR